MKVLTWILLLCLCTVVWIDTALLLKSRKRLNDLENPLFKRYVLVDNPGREKQIYVMLDMVPIVEGSKYHQPVYLNTEDFKDFILDKITDSVKKDETKRKQTV